MPVRRLSAGEQFKPAFGMDRLDAEFPDSMHRKMKYARDYIRILNDTGELTAGKWGVLDELADAVPSFAARLNLQAPSQVKAAAIPAATQAVRQRMAGDAIRQYATSRARSPVLLPTVDEIRRFSGGSQFAVFNRSFRDLDFSPIEKPGSFEGAIEGIRRIPGRTEYVDPARKIALADTSLRNGSVLYHPDDIESLWTGHPTWDTSAAAEGAYLNIESLKGKILDAHILKRGAGRLTPEDGALIADYRYGGLHSSPQSRARQREALNYYHELARGKQRADKADDIFEMFGNFVNPYLSDTAVASPEFLYRGDVVPAEVAAAYRPGDGLRLSQTRAGAGSFSVEPFQAYRYASMKRDGRLERALSDSPSGLAVRRITEVRPKKGSLLPVINSDASREGKSEVLHPLVSSDLKMVSQRQIFNAAEPQIPLIWQVFQ